MSAQFYRTVTVTAAVLCQKSKTKANQTKIKVFVFPLMSLQPSHAQINYTDTILLVLPRDEFVAITLHVCTPFLLITCYFATLLDCKRATLFLAFIGFNFSSLFIPLFLHLISCFTFVDIDWLN